MAILHDILYDAGMRSLRGSTSVDVTSVHIDSREVQPGGCFIAIPGAAVDGHSHISDAIGKGAAVIVCQRLPEFFSDNVTYVQVADSARAAGTIAHEFFGKPSTLLKLVGVTGTNGKTTIATLLWQLYTGLGHECGLISTVVYRVAAEELPSSHTTPDPVSLNRLLRRMVDAGCTHAFMECSSHAIHQHRMAGLRFSGAVFSNITHDHLDYHGSFDEYIRVKKSFFDMLPVEAFAISNLDDKRGAVMLQNTSASKYYYSLRAISDFRGRILDNGLTGLHMLIDEREVHFRLIGEFNAYNLLATYATAVCLGDDRDEVLRVLSRIRGAEGRFDPVVSPKDRIVGIVDYAHTPDALLNVLATLRKVARGGERIITVVGCGGDRDRTKRPVMGDVASRYSDRVVFTSDNPRREEPGRIILEMEQGVSVDNKRKTVAIPDRREAIKAAVSMAGPEDIVLLAGKGHEKYQETSGVRKPFDDRAVLIEMFEMMGR